MRAVYGGQVVGMALVAACRNVHDLDPSFLLQSFHCYFVGPTQTSPEVIFTISRVKEGKNFCSVSVVAVQGDKVCFHCLVSFQKPEPVRAELKYSAHSMPAVLHPDRSEITSKLDEKDLATSGKKLLVDLHPRWNLRNWPVEMYICTDVATARKQLAQQPIEPRSVCNLVWDFPS